MEGFVCADSSRNVHKPQKRVEKGRKFRVEKLLEFMNSFSPFFLFSFLKLFAVLCDMIIIVTIGVYKALPLINWTSIFETITLNAALQTSKAVRVPVNTDVSSWSTDWTEHAARES